MPTDRDSSPSRPFGSIEGYALDDSETLLYLTVSQADWCERPPQEKAWAAAQQFLQRQIGLGGGRWWHRSPTALCVAFEQRSAAFRAAWRLPQLPVLRPSGRWRLSLDAVRSERTVGPAAQAHHVARLHGMAQVATDSLPVMGAGLRDQVLEPLEAQVEDLGLCHLKHQSAVLRAYRLHKPQQPACAARHDGRPSLVLLAPVALSDSPAHRAFGALLVDRVSQQLGRSRHVRLVHPLSSRSLTGRPQALQEAHHWLAADYVLQGSYRMVGEHLQGSLELRLSLHDMRQGVQVWAQAFRASVGDVLSSDSELTHAVSTGVHHAVLDAHMDWVGQQPLRHLDDYSLLLAGVGLMHRSAPDDFELSRRALLALLERAPSLGQAHAWLAKWHVLRVTRALTDQPQQDADVAQAHAQQAEAASDARGLARAMQGFVRLHLRRDLPGALADLRKCTQTHPNEPLAWLFRGVAEAFSDHGSQALQASRQALQPSPLDPLLYYFESLAASSALVCEDAALAGRWCEQSLRRNLMHLHTHRAYIAALVQQGDLAAARMAAGQLRRLAPGYTVAHFVRNGSSAQTPLGLRIRDAMIQAGVPAGE